MADGWEAPPSYEESMKHEPTAPVACTSGSTPAMGPSTSHVQSAASMSQAPSLLTFVDFLPRLLQTGNRSSRHLPSFESFRHILTYVNSWLSTHPDCRIMSIEEISRSVNWEGTYDIDNPLTLTTAGDTNLLVRGLRIWMRQRFQSDNSPTEQLDYFNFLPQREQNENGRSDDNNSLLTIQIGHLHFKMPSFLSRGHSGGQQGFYNLDESLQMLNSLFVEKSIPGQVVSIRTVQLPLGRVNYLSQIEVTENLADRTLINNPGSGNAFFNFIRVYFTHGQPASETQEVGMVDFIPQLISMNTSINESPKFESTGVLIQRTAAWAQTRHGNDMHITNFQTLTLTTCWEYPFRETSINSRRTCVYFGGLRSKMINIKFLRVNYIRPVQVPRPPLMLSTRTIPPVLLRLRTAETIAQTVDRINHWISQAGAYVIGVETLDEFYHEHTGKIDMLDSSFITYSGKGHYTINTIRLYISGTYADVEGLISRPKGKIGCVIM